MVPVSYNYRNLLVRWKTTFMTASGFTLVVAALVVMLAFINGIQTVCATSGEPENVIVLSKGNNDEVMSQIERDVVALIETSKGIARASGGQTLASRELYMVVHHFNERNRLYEFLQVRGVLPVAPKVHTQMRLVDGQMGRPGQSEIAIGRAVQREQGLAVGDTVDMGRKKWKVAGVFEAGGSAFESEVWCDLNELASQFRREGVISSVVLRARDAESAVVLAQAIGTSRRLSVDALTETKYYEKQGEQTRMLQYAAWVIAWFMGVGAIFGVMNTMFAAIGHRIKDIAVMRIMGYASRDILISFLLEAILISLIGGGLGLALGYATNGVTRSTAVGSRQIEFAFRVDGAIVMLAGAFTVGMGVMGGLLPAMSAMRIKPLEALK